MQARPTPVSSQSQRGYGLVTDRGREELLVVFALRGFLAQRCRSEETADLRRRQLWSELSLSAGGELVSR